MHWCHLCDNRMSFNKLWKCGAPGDCPRFMCASCLIERAPRTGEEQLQPSHKWTYYCEENGHFRDMTPAGRRPLDDVPAIPLPKAPPQQNATPDATAFFADLALLNEDTAMCSGK